MAVFVFAPQGKKAESCDIIAVKQSTEAALPVRGKTARMAVFYRDPGEKYGRIKLISLQRFACSVLLVAFMVFTSSRSALADAPDTFAMFMQSDSLLGKTTQSVLNQLGPPKITEQISQGNLSPHVIGWRYLGAEDNPSLELYFSDKVLVLAEIGFQSSDQQPDLTFAFKTCKLSSLKIAYVNSEVEGKATVGSLPFGFSVTGTTQKGHMLRAQCEAGPIYPLTHTRVMNATTGLYENKFILNPDFSVKSIYSHHIVLSLGNGAPYERYYWTRAEMDVKFRQPNLTTYLIGAFGGYELQPVTVIPMTPQNSPWLLQ